MDGYEDCFEDESQEFYLGEDYNIWEENEVARDNEGQDLDALEAEDAFLDSEYESRTDLGDDFF